MDTMVSFKDDSLMKFYTKDEIREKAPYVFSTNPTNPNLSDRYVFASTETIIDDMEKLGWGVVDCRQQRANKRSNVRSFHMVTFQNPNIFINKNDGNTKDIECYPRIILTNSHDGFNSFKFMVGLFRLVCSNGLVVATEQFANISIRHINYTFEELREVVAKAISSVTDNIGIMNRMQQTTLNDEQKRDFAIKALSLRSNNTKPDKVYSDKEISQILTPLRNEDEGDSLWNVFNVIQERIISGNFYLQGKNKKDRKARPITGVFKDLSVNQNLFKTAISYCEAA